MPTIHEDNTGYSWEDGLRRSPPDHLILWNIFAFLVVANMWVSDSVKTAVVRYAFKSASGVGYCVKPRVAHLLVESWGYGACMLPFAQPS